MIILNTNNLQLYTMKYYHPNFHTVTSNTNDYMVSTNNFRLIICLHTFI